MTEHQVAQEELQSRAEAICPGARARLRLDLLMRPGPARLAKWQVEIEVDHYQVVFVEGEWGDVVTDALEQLREFTASR